jgi:hypothetical protein
MKKSMFFVFACIILMACDTAIQEPVSDDMFLLKSKRLSVESCENVRVQGVFELGGPIYFDFSGMPNLLNALIAAGAFDEHPEYGEQKAFLISDCMVVGGGANQEKMTLAGVEGVIGSIITHEYAANENSAVFRHLFHFFKSDEGAFVTWDHAVQSPMNPKNYTARINNKLEVLAGTGIFENASGKLINNGMIDFNTFTLHADVHGRICGDGLGQ